jgi:hypothetical protein
MSLMLQVFKCRQLKIQAIALKSYTSGPPDLEWALLNVPSFDRHFSRLMT